MWKSSTALLRAIHNAHRRLKRNEIDVARAHAEARLLVAATQVLATSLEHAKLTARLKEGDANLPPMTIPEEED